MDALVSLRNEVKAGKEVKASSIVTNMYLGYKFPGKREKGEYRKPPEEVLQYYAPLLVKDQGFVSAIQGTNLLLWLQEQAKVPFRPTSLAPDEFPYLLVPRSKMSKPATAASQPEIVQTAAPIKDKTPTPVSSKRPTGRPRKSVLRLATGSRKRPHSELEYGSDPDDFENKRSNYFSDDNETVDGIVGHDNASEDSHELVEKASPIPDLNEPVRLVIRGESVATPAVVGDETRWVCEHNGCAYVVRNEADHIAQERIRSHMEEHAEEDQRVSLALSESRAHLPIEYAENPFSFLQSIFRHPAFAPFLPRVQNPTARASSPTGTAPPAPVPEKPLEQLRLAPATRVTFRRLVDQFRRNPHPVSDRLADMDTLQSLARED